MLLVAAIAGGLISVFSLYTLENEGEIFAKDDLTYFGLFIASAILALITIFLFKNRKLQFVLNRLNILLNLILLGIFVYRILNLSGGTEIVSEKGIGVILPIISIVLLVLANRAIKKDEDLVKSVDRLR
jgi:succinate-acetate transporter protein